MDNLFDQGEPATEIHWIITDSNELAQDFISKNNLPKSLTEDEFPDIIIGGEIQREKDEDDNSYALRRMKIFSGALMNFYRFDWEPVTIVSICSKEEVGLGTPRNFYRPKDYPESFSFFTKSSWVLLTDGTCINLRAR